jgi:hypothetical protein
MDKRWAVFNMVTKRQVVQTARNFLLALRLSISLLGGAGYLTGASDAKLLGNANGGEKNLVNIRGNEVVHNGKSRKILESATPAYRI